ncbi:ARM repeat-containing protein [Ramaria rubella]|nr:ARM repeat-containing protein [Ramaria rubella]
MSYIPLYPQSPNTHLNTSIWAPNQFRKIGSPTHVWPRMPVNSLPEHPPASVHNSPTSVKSLSRTPSYNLLDDRDFQDVFGPVMHNNDPRTTRALDVKKDVGAIGDRRKKDDGRSAVADVQDTSDSSSAFAVGQLLRTLEFTPSLPAEPFLRHPKASRMAQFPLDESPSASSNSSSPSVLDFLQTPSDTSPLARRSPHAFDMYNDKDRLTPSNAKMIPPYPYENHGDNRPISFSRGLSGKPLDPTMFRGFTPTPPNGSESLYTPQSASLSSSGRSLPIHSFPLVEKPSPSPGLYHSSFLPQTTYQGAFDPFGNDTSPGSGPIRFRSGSFRPGPSDDTTSPWSHHHQSNASSLSSNTSPDWTHAHSSPEYPHGVCTTSPTLYLGPLQRRSSSDSQLSGLVTGSTPPFEHKQIASFVGQNVFEHPQQHVSGPLSNGPTVDLNFAEHDMLRGLGITGLTRRDKPRLGQGNIEDRSLDSSVGNVYANDGMADKQQGNEPINFLHLLAPTAVPPYSHFITRIVKSSDQQASIFLQQKLKIADATERKKIVDAVSQRGIEMMTNRFGNWAVQRCLEPPCELADRMKIVQCMRGRVVELATNCYGTHVLQKALDCEEDVRLLVVSELLLGDPSSTLLNKHSAHVWSKIMELTWTPPAPPIFAYVNKSLAGKWASLACHETGSLVVQTAFEQCEEVDKELIIGELLDEEAFGEVVTNAWGNFCILHLLEHGSPQHRSLAITNLVNGLSQYASHEQSIKSVLKALKEGGPEVLDKVVVRLCEPPKGGRRASLVDISLSPIGSQLVGTILPNVNKEQRSALYEAIRGHVVTLRGSRVGSKVIWLFDRMRAYYGY